MPLKRIKLANGKWISRREPESSPLELNTAQPEEIWKTSNGRRILIKDMETRHIANVMAILETRCKPTQARLREKLGADAPTLAQVTGEAYPSYRLMEAQLIERHSATKPPAKRAFNLEE